jgi:hypothetical protein
VEPAERINRFTPVRAIALGVFLLALLIRLPGIGWGLKNDLHNASYHPDEDPIFGYSRAIVPGQGHFLPGFYNYGTLYLTLLRVASDITTTYTGGPKVPGDGFSMSNPDRTDWDWVSRCHMAGRLISAVAGAGTALIVFCIGLRCFGVGAGGISGLVMAIAPAFVMHSRFQTVDVVAMFFLSCSALYAIRLTKEERSSWMRLAIWCGVFAGLSAGTKYTGILALCSLYAALAVVGKGSVPLAIKAAAAGTGAAVAAFAVTTPGFILQNSVFLRDFSYEMVHTQTGHDIVFTGTPSAFVYHLANLGIGVDGLLVALGLAGVVWAAYRRHPWALVLLAFWVPYYFVISRAEVKFIRYSIPLELAVSIGCGYAIVAAHRRGGWGRIAVGVGILGFGGLGGGGLASTISLTRKMMATDPRDEAASYLRAQGGRVGMPRDPWFWSPPLFSDSAEPRSVPWPRRFQELTSLANPPIDLVLNPDGSPTEWDPKLVTNLHPDRISFGSFEYLPVERLKRAQGLPGDQQALINTANVFMDALQTNYLQDRAFGSQLSLVVPTAGWFPEDMMPEDFLYSQPIVWIWKRK